MFSKESQQKTINLPDDDPETIERVISYLYLHEYQGNGHIVPLSVTAIRNSPLKSSTKCPADVGAIARHHVRVYIAADKFGIAPLKSYAAKEFAHKMNANWKFTVFLDIAREVMSPVSPHDSGLREIIADIMSKNLTDMKRGLVLQLTKDFESLGSAILARLLENNMMRESEAERDEIV